MDYRRLLDPMLAAWLQEPDIPAATSIVELAIKFNVPLPEEIASDPGAKGTESRETCLQNQLKLYTSF